MIVPESARKLIKMQRSGGREYWDNISKDFELIKDYLPYNSVPLLCLDIGCGLAGIDIMINNHLKGEAIFHLADYNKTDEKVYYGFNSEACKYNSEKVMDEMISSNTNMIYRFIDLGKEKLSDYTKYDLIISLLSCGYHYPIETYLGYIKKQLSIEGVFICDVRSETNGLNILKKHFKSVKIISTENKADKVCCQTLK